MSMKSGEIELGHRTIPAMFWVSQLILSLLLVPIPAVLLTVIRAITNSFSVTSQRVTGRYGLFGTSEFDLALDKISIVQSNQSILGRIFNFGTIHVKDNSGEGPIWLTAAPHKLKAIIFDAQEKYKEEQMKKLGAAMRAS